MAMVMGPSGKTEGRVYAYGVEGERAKGSKTKNDVHQLYWRGVKLYLIFDSMPV